MQAPENAMKRSEPPGVGSTRDGSRQENLVRGPSMSFGANISAHSESARVVGDA